MMSSIRRMAAAAAISLACVGALQAHHSASMFELLTPVWVEGSIVRFDRIDPHSITTVEARMKDGQLRRWAVEGPGAFQFERRGIAADLLKTGDVVRFCAFPLKEEFRARPPSKAAVDTAQFVHGHVLVKADGNRRMWGSYGTLSACIQTSTEPRQAWLAFLNSDPSVQQMWCNQRGMAPIQATPSLKAFMEEVTRLLSRPCV